MGGSAELLKGALRANQFQGNYGEGDLQITKL